MSRTHRDQEAVWAVLRWDAFHGPDARPEVAVTVQQVVRSRPLAEAEVARLDALAADGVQYFWQATRVFPAGRAAGSAEAEPVAAVDGGSKPPPPLS